MSDNSDTGIRPSFSRVVPRGDDRVREVCDTCGFIHYVNPKIVVGAVAVWEGRYLLCRRAIEPRKGFWTIPAGYLETGETAEEGARREAWEEARADLVLEALLAVYSIPRISQVQLIYKAALKSGEVAAGEESEEVALFMWSEIPWKDLAFPSVDWALRHHDEAAGRRQFAAFTAPENSPNERPPGL